MRLDCVYDEAINHNLRQSGNSDDSAGCRSQGLSAAHALQLLRFGVHVVLMFVFLKHSLDLMQILGTGQFTV